jgi:hypothetical protein
VSDPIPSLNSPLLRWVGGAAFAGIAVFALLVWRSVTVEQAQPEDAMRRFAEIRTGIARTEPVLRLDAAGHVARREPPPESETVRATRLRVLAYRAPEQRLVRADVPFWFLRVKGPALQYSLHDTGLDLERLGVTPADLDRYGVCLVLDETRANGDRLLVWTE